MREASALRRENPPKGDGVPPGSRSKELRGKESPDSVSGPRRDVPLSAKEIT